MYVGNLLLNFFNCFDIFVILIFKLWYGVLWRVLMDVDFLLRVFLEFLFLLLFILFKFEICFCFEDERKLWLNLFIFVCIFRIFNFFNIVCNKLCKILKLIVLIFGVFRVRLIIWVSFIWVGILNFLLIFDW